MLDRVNRRFATAPFWAVFAAALSLACVPFAWLALRGGEGGAGWAFAALLLAAAIGGAGALVAIRRRRVLDEAERAASAAAWQAGGGAGYLIGGVLCLIGTSPLGRGLDIPPLMGRTDPAAYMAFGAILLITLMAAGHGMAWLAWWRFEK